MKHDKSILVFLTILLMVSASTCISTKIPTLAFSEYRLDPGPSQSQRNADVEITLKAIQLSEVYKYPKLFSFDLDQMPEAYRSSAVLRSEYREGMDGKSWEYPFATPDGKLQLLLCYCNVKNNTKHILRMGDARIYLVIEGIDPIRAVISFDELLEIADDFQSQTNLARSKQTTWGILAKPMLPAGFFRAIVLFNRQAYKLVNDLKHEILPGFSYEGILAFPAAPSIVQTAMIDFFDVTIRTDQAGNPVEKTKFEFGLRSEYVTMYYDVTEKKWVIGSPPADKGSSSEQGSIEANQENPILEEKAERPVEKSDQAIPQIASLLVVRVRSANIRQEPNLGAKIIASVKQGDQLRLIAMAGEWFKILIETEDGTTTGYIFGSLVERK